MTPSALRGEQGAWIDGPPGLAARIHPGAGAGAALVCHPHPVLGGDMDNKVVVHLTRGLAEGGLTTLRFNFRGVGESEGAWDEGRGELDDARRALDALLDHTPPDRRRPLVLAGYSFGSWIAARLAGSRGDVDVLILVAPPVLSLPFDPPPGGPVLALVGEHDPVSAPPDVEAWLGDAAGARLAVQPGADHLFHGAGPWMRQEIGVVLRALGG